MNLKTISFYIFIIITFISFLGTFILLLPGSELVKDKSSLGLLLLLDTILVIILASLLIRQILLIFINKRKDYSSSKLYIKFINLFTVISLGPTIGVVIIAALFFNLEIANWYGAAVKSTIVNSNAVANEYLLQKQENLEVNIQSISKDIFEYGLKNNLTRSELQRIIKNNFEIKKLEDIFVFDISNDIIAYKSLKNGIENFLPPNNNIINIINSGKIYINQKNNNILSAYYKLPFLKNTYLLINDDINETIYNHLFETAKAITAYKNLENKNSNIQISFSMIFVLFSVCLLLISLLLGFRMAGKLSEPISNLIKSSQKVSKGNFDAKVSEINDYDEISLLLKSFNKMIFEIEKQQKKLIENNVEIENRRLFTEAVLASLSTGVIALNKNFNITLSNESVKEIINKSEKEIIGKNLFDIFPTLVDIKSKIENNKNNNLTKQIEYNINNNIKNLFIKIATEIKQKNIIGYVVTIDDLTSLILAEKHAAWSDIARKIAHEIKNPLTPIKLSAERIEKKIQDNKFDKNNFISLAKTISSQVDDIGKLIDEFSSFARLPEADIKKDDFINILNECFNFYANAHTDINFKLENKYDKIICPFDRFQMSLVINNLTKKENVGDSPLEVKNGVIQPKNEYSTSNFVIGGIFEADEILMTSDKVFKSGIKDITKDETYKKTINDQMNDRFEELKKTINLKGFRPGKVPIEVLKRQFGKAVYGEVLEKILRETSSKAIEEKKIKVAGQPKLDIKSYGEGKDLNYTLEIDELPAIKLQQIDKINFIDYEINVNDQETDKRINDIAKNQNNFKDKNENDTAENGDLITFDYEATIDTKSFEGGQGKNTQIVLGKDLFIKGFDKQLIGVKKNQEKEVSAILPENYPKKEFANKKANFKCKILSLKKPEDVKIDDQFAKNFGAKDLADLKKLIKKQIQNQYKMSLDSISKESILNQIEKLHNIDLPDNLVQQELQIISQGLKKEDLDNNKTEREKIAKKRIKLGLILNEFGEKHNLKVDENELKNEIQKQVQSMPEQQKQILEYYQKNPSATASLRGSIYEEKIINLIKQKSKQTKKTISLKEAEVIIKSGSEDKKQNQSTTEKEKSIKPKKPLKSSKKTKKIRKK